MLTNRRHISCFLMAATCGVIASVGSAESVGAGARVDRDQSGRFWIEAGGQRLLSVGVNTVTPSAWNPREGTSYYNAIENQFDGDRAAWERSTENMLLSSGFNTLGCWSDIAFDSDELLTTPILYIADHGADRYLAGLERDFEDQVRQRTQAVLEGLARPERVLGFFLDNEVAWWGRTGWDRIPNYTPLEAAFERPRSDSAHQRARAFLRERFATLDDLSRAFGVALEDWDEFDIDALQQARGSEAIATRSAFTALVAEEYFSRACGVVRQLAPEALILGVRFAGDAPDEVIRACGRHCDVVSVNHYRPNQRATREMIDRCWILGQKPIMVTEFSWRAEENQSGNPNDRGAGPVVETQVQRAESYSRFIRDLAAYPTVVGWQWFEWADQSPQGRFDGENSNYGIVDIHHRPYSTMLAAMSRANGAASDRHAESTRALPAELPPTERTRYRPGQHPDRPPRLSLLEDGDGSPELWHAGDASISLGREDQTLSAQIDTGHQYGVGISFRGPTSMTLADGPEFCTDLDGYEWLVFEAEIPQGLLVQIVINESGAANPHNSSFDLRGGDDGESFISPPALGKPGLSLYRFRIDEFVRQVYWGNQAGGREIDMRSIQSIAVQLQGEPRQGTIRIHDLRLER